MKECKCCGGIKQLRMGFCFDCAEAESVIVEGVDMYDKEIPIVDGLSKGMSKLQYILKKYIDVKKPTTIKLYTEEQVRKVWNTAYTDALAIDEEDYKPKFYNDFIKELTPIELPSDEES